MALAAFGRLTVVASAASLSGTGAETEATKSVSRNANCPSTKCLFSYLSSVPYGKSMASLGFRSAIWSPANRAYLSG